MLYVDERPETFDEVKEQEFVVRNLKAQAKRGAFFNSIILCGKYGTGKTTVARIIAKAANCEDRDAEGNPCMKCRSCRSIMEKSDTDVIEIDGASNNGVDAARRLMKEINFVPVSKHKVVIIDECHRISSSAWDALLKTLEEPPEHAIFILCTTDEMALPETIRSRAPVYRFESISAGMLCRHAKEMAQKHGINISDNAVSLLASYADGSMRNVLSLLEQMSLQGSDITEGDVEMLLGINHYTFTIEFIAALLSGSLSLCISSLNQLVTEGRSVRLFARDIMKTAVDMVLQRTGISPDNGNPEYLACLESEAGKHDINQLNLLADVSSGLEKRMRKESDAYVMYGEIISMFRKLHKENILNGLDGFAHETQTKERVPHLPEEIISPVNATVSTAETKEAVKSGLTDGVNDIPDDGIVRSMGVLPDLEMALADFLPDLKHQPRGRFEKGLLDGVSGVKPDMMENAGSECIEGDWTEYIPDSEEGKASDGALEKKSDDVSDSTGEEESDDLLDNAFEEESDDIFDDPEESETDYISDDLEKDEYDEYQTEDGGEQEEDQGDDFDLPPLNLTRNPDMLNIFGLPAGFGVPRKGKDLSFS